MFYSVVYCLETSYRLHKCTVSTIRRHIESGKLPTHSCYCSTINLPSEHDEYEVTSSWHISILKFWMATGRVSVQCSYTKMGAKKHSINS